MMTQKNMEIFAWFELASGLSKFSLHSPDQNIKLGKTNNRCCNHCSYYSLKENTYRDIINICLVSKHSALMVWMLCTLTVVVSVKIYWLPRYEQANAATTVTRKLNTVTTTAFTERTAEHKWHVRWTQTPRGFKMRREKGTSWPCWPKSAKVPWWFLSCWAKYQYTDMICNNYRACVLYKDCRECSPVDLHSVSFSYILHWQVLLWFFLSGPPTGGSVGWK